MPHPLGFVCIQVRKLLSGIRICQLLCLVSGLGIIIDDPVKEQLCRIEIAQKLVFLPKPVDTVSRRVIVSFLFHCDHLSLKKWLHLDWPVLPGGFLNQPEDYNVHQHHEAHEDGSGKARADHAAGIIKPV